MRRPRVLIAKVGLDGHDAGARAVARGLVDAGMEVIYTGIRQTPQTIVATAIQEDVDVVGISILSGAHLHYVPRIIDMLRESGADDVMVLVGGVIPKEDVAVLIDKGVHRVFHADALITDIAGDIRAWLESADGHSAAVSGANGR
jgi:methylmalonyl-CoA mutase, C-terminal domain